MTFKTHKKAFYIATLLAPVVAGGTVLFCIVLGEFLYPSNLGSTLPTLSYLTERPLEVMYLIGIFTAFGYIAAFPALLILGLPAYVIIVKNNISICYYFLLALMTGAALGYLVYISPNNMLFRYNFFGTMLIGMLPALTVTSFFHLIVQKWATLGKDNNISVR